MRRVGGRRLRLATMASVRGLGALDQLGNELGLRKVPPVALGHLRGHGADLQPRGVEDRGVVGAPVVLQRVLGAAPRRGRRPRRGQAPRRPSAAQTSGVRIEKRMIGEAADEEVGVQLEHPVRRLEPGDVGLGLDVLRLRRKRTKACILCCGAVHRLGACRARAATSGSVASSSRSGSSFSRHSRR